MMSEEVRVSPNPAEVEGLDEALQMAIAPIHKMALGVATGLVSGLAVFVATAVIVILQPQPQPRLDLLAHYFYGYTVTWRGATLGFCWAFGVGFVGGWFVGFVRNFVTAVWIFFVRTRAQFSRNFLDHI
jgi:hypothetical protein